MARVKRGVKRRIKREKVLGQAKGYWGAKSSNYRTAKEAVVKSTGTGLAGLKSCRVLDVPDSATVTLSYQGREYDVAQLHHAGHLVAVIRDGRPLEWVVLD